MVLKKSNKLKKYKNNRKKSKIVRKKSKTVRKKSKSRKAKINKSKKNKYSKYSKYSKRGGGPRGVPGCPFYTDPIMCNLSLKWLKIINQSLRTYGEKKGTEECYFITENELREIVYLSLVDIAPAFMGIPKTDQSLVATYNEKKYKGKRHSLCLKNDEVGMTLFENSETQETFKDEGGDICFDLTKIEHNSSVRDWGKFITFKKPWHYYNKYPLENFNKKIENLTKKLYENLFFKDVNGELIKPQTINSKYMRLCTKGSPLAISDSGKIEHQDDKLKILYETDFEKLYKNYSMPKDKASLEGKIYGLIRPLWEVVCSFIDAAYETRKYPDSTKNETPIITEKEFKEKSVGKSVLASDYLKRSAIFLPRLLDIRPRFDPDEQKDDCPDIETYLASIKR